jgi:hypothetical protein
MATRASEPSPRVEQQIIEHLRAISTGIGELLKEVREIKEALSKTK